MEENKLFKIAIVTSLVGLFVMIFISENIEVLMVKIGNINEEMLGEKVNINGVVNSKRDLPGIVILNVSDDTGSIKVVAYKKNKKILVKKNDNVDVEGLVRDYEGELEVMAEMINKY